MRPDFAPIQRRALMLACLALGACGGASDEPLLADAASSDRVAEASAASTGQSVTILRYKERSAFATFSSLDVTGCIRNDVLVNISETGSKTFPSTDTVSKPFAVIGVQRFDMCNAVFLNDIFGQVSPGDTPFTQFEVQYQAPLRKAHLRAVVPSVELVTFTNIVMVVDVTWEATGPVSTLNESSRIDSGTNTIYTHLLGLTRPAKAVGAVMFKDGQYNYIPEPSQQATIVRLQQGEVTIAHTESAPVRR